MGARVSSVVSGAVVVWVCLQAPRGSLPPVWRAWCRSNPGLGSGLTLILSLVAPSWLMFPRG